MAGTGHRPKDLGLPPDVPYSSEVVELCRSHVGWFSPTLVISGMALGLDLALAQAAKDEEIPLLAAIPFDGQEERWFNPETRSIYFDLRDYAKEVVVVSPGGYEPWKMQARNRFMVDRCDFLLALWSGRRRGGTFNCLQYAESKHCQMANIWPDFERL